jgi:hypothetical protein
MRKSTFASLASLALSLSLALTGCQVGDEGDGGGGGGDPKPDAGGGNPGTPDAGAAQACPPSAEDFKTDVFDVALKADFGCVGCHSSGVGGFTLSATDQAANLQAATNKAKKLDGAKAILVTKPTGTSTVAHGGGKKYEANSAEAQALEKFIGQVTGAPGACPP